MATLRSRLLHARLRPWAVPCLLLFTCALFAACEVGRPRAPLVFEETARQGGFLVGRMAAAGWIFVGALAVYVTARLLVDGRTGTYAAIVFLSLPVVFVSSRLADGAAQVLGGAALVFAGLALAGLAPGRRLRGLGLFVAAVGVGATREAGLVEAVGPPALAVGIAAALERRRAAFVFIALALALAASMLFVAPSGSRLASALVGPLPTGAPKAFTLAVSQLAYALAIWAPFVPFALVARPSSSAHLAAMIGGALAIAAHVAIHPAATVVFAGAPMLAISIGATLRSLDSGRRVPAVVTLTVLVIGGLLAGDVGIMPDRLATAIAAHPSAGAAAVAVVPQFRATAWIFAVASSAILFVGDAWVRALTDALLGQGGALVALGFVGSFALRDAVFGNLLRRLSPGDAVEAYLATRLPGDAIATLGLDPSVARALHTNEVVPTLLSADEGAAWLSSTGRFLAFSPSDLPALNAKFRAREARNLPVVAGQGTAVLLATGKAVVPSRNPLEDVVFDVLPKSASSVQAAVGEHIEVLGWEVLGAGLTVGHASHLRVYVRASRPSALAGHCTFLHIDARPFRFSAEHRELAYPSSLWRANDIVADEFDVDLPRSFHAGRVEAYWGVGVLPCQDDRRMPVTRGQHDAAGRVRLGEVEAR